MYVSTTSDNSSVGSAVSSPHFSRLFSNVDRFFRLHPSREYLSLSMPAHQKNDHGSKKRLILKECAKIGKVRKKGRERRLERWMEECMARRVAKGIRRRGKV